MIAYTMLYAAAVSVPVLLSAWVVADVLRRHGRGERLVWLAGLALAFVLPVIGLMWDGGATAGSGAQAALERATGVIGLPTVFVVADGSTDSGAQGILIVIWAAASALLALRYAVSALRLARAGRSWRESTLDGVSVWLTDRIGPAVSGFLRPRVLVPSWLASMPADRRSLVLLHEQEHIRAGDPWLMLLSRIAPIAAPWNPVVWLLSARLLRAIELDCDRRVLRHRPDVRAYGTTLIEISGRDSDRLVPVAAFAESEAPLRKRILNMTTPSRTVSVLALLTSMVFGVVLIVAAFEIPVPTIRAELEIGPQVAEAPVVEPAADPPLRPEVRNGEAPSIEPVQGEIEIPPPPARPAEAPVAAEEVITGLRGEEEGITSHLQGPDGPDDISAAPTFTPFTVAPVLTNLREVQQALIEEYPQDLREAGIGGTVTVWFFIDADGQVEATRIDRSSGHQPLDRAALNMAGVYRFSPALNRDERVPVWVSLPITFQVR